MKNSGLFAALLAVGLSGEAMAQALARLEVIHNAADAAAAQVDVYVNGALLIDNFAFRTTSGFIDVPAGVDLVVGIAPPTSASAAEAIAEFTFNLADGGKYIAIANGIVSPSGYSPSPGFNIDVFADAREIASDPSLTDVLVYHGATDAPAVDVEEVGVGAGIVVNDVAYSGFQGYLELPAVDFVLQIQEGVSNGAVAAYDAPLGTLGLQGAALTVLASGFLDPSANSDGPGFGLFVSLGVAGDLIPLPASTARLEVIHNAADAAAAQVDVYLNGALLINNFAFRTTSGFITAPAAMPLEIAIAGPNSASVAEAIATFPVTLASGETYVVVANGIVSGSGYNPAPAFGLDVFAGAREAAVNGNETDILVYHGATDAPAVDVVETGAGAGTVVSSIAYGEFQGYLSVGPADYVLGIVPSGGSEPLVSYDLSTQLSGGRAVTVLASGFLDPSANSAGAGFGLWYSTGEAGDLQPLSVASSVGVEELGNGFSLFPNPTDGPVSLQLGNGSDAEATVVLRNMLGMEVMAEHIGNKSGTGAQRLDVSHLPAGLYILTVAHGGSSRTARLQVLR